MSALDGAVALVTGSSRGIGAAIAAEFARRGPLGIRANCIAPETILTEGNGDRIPDEMRSAP